MQERGGTLHTKRNLHFMYNEHSYLLTYDQSKLRLFYSRFNDDIICLVRVESFSDCEELSCRCIQCQASQVTVNIDLLRVAAKRLMDHMAAIFGLETINQSRRGSKNTFREITNNVSVTRFIYIVESGIPMLSLLRNSMTLQLEVAYVVEYV